MVGSRATATRLRPIAKATGDYLRASSFRGYDPYDVLTSPLFRLPGLRSSHVLRFGAQQAFRRLPLNIRPLLRIPTGLNPVTIALGLQGDALLGVVHDLDARVGLLEAMSSPGYSGACWGYDFDWEARHVSLPAFTPTVVATGFVTNALFHAYERSGIDTALSLCESATKFVLGDLRESHDDHGGICWSYSPFDDQTVLNASMLGARLCAQVASRGQFDPKLREKALAAARFVIRAQRDDGSWPYAVRDPRSWSDGFHTGYVIEALVEVGRLAGNAEFDDAVERGAAFYRRRLFDGAVPKYYSHKRHPVDASACAQAMITFCALGDLEFASEIAAWTIDHMRRSDGSFTYRVHRFYRDNTPYIRWSTAWLYVALARLVAELEAAG